MLEVLSSDFEVMEILVTPEFFELYSERINTIPEVQEVKASELAGLGSFQSNDGALAVVRTKPNTPWFLDQGYGLVLDQLNDPGNLGTILRIADWFGIKGIIASSNVPDVYNPKVISASKGSFSRVPLYYTDLVSFLKETTFPVFGADLAGEDVHTFSFPETGWIVMGNETHGISAAMDFLLTSRITIPSYGKAESLNVGMATAIICDNLRRNLGG